MDDSDEEGFHQATLEFMTVRSKNLVGNTPKNQQFKLPFNRSPISLHHQLKLYEYPPELEQLGEPSNQTSEDGADSTESLEVVTNQEGICPLLSQFFPRKMACVYNRFHENLMLKRDMTLVIRNLTRRVCNDQLTGFNEKTRPPSHFSPSFSSDFEGGNLHCAFKCKKSNYYYLFLQDDINTHGYSIWFHFNVRSIHQGKYQFVIVNMTRPIRFCEDVRLLTYSSISKKYERKVIIKCVESSFKNCQTQKKYFCLHFQYEFRQGETVYFSAAPPYSFTKVANLLQEIEYPFSKTKVTVQMAAKTEIGNSIPSIKISNIDKPSKKIVLITARQHPCETVGSFVCENMIKLLVSQSELAQKLLKKFTFIAIPMINVDGVIHGNSRTNLLGYDLNRSWEDTVPYKSVECHLLWEYFWKIYQENDGFSWTFDLHGHSKELGFMTYFSEENDDSLIFNHLMKDKSQLYSTNRCTFGISGTKKDALRGQLYSKMKAKNALTIQTSYFGFKDKDGCFKHWNNSHFAEIAHTLLETLMDNEELKKDKPSRFDLLQEISKIPKPIKNLSAKFLKQLDSDSDPEQGYLRSEEREENHIIVEREKPNKSVTSHLKVKTEPPVSLIKSQLAVSSEDKYLSELMIINPKKIPRRDFTFKSTRRSKVEEDHPSNNFSFVKSKKKFKELHSRQNSKSANRRKIFSEHKYMINGLHQLEREEEQVDLPLKKTLQMKKALSKRMSNPSYRIKTEGQRSELQRSQLGRSRNGKEKQKNRPESEHQSEQTLKLHTILYPTSNYAGYSLNNQFKALRAKMKVIKNSIHNDSTKRVFLNTYYGESNIKRLKKLK